MSKGDPESWRSPPEFCSRSEGVSTGTSVGRASVVKWSGVESGVSEGWGQTGSRHRRDEFHTSWYRRVSYSGCPLYVGSGKGMGGVCREQVLPLCGWRVDSPGDGSRNGWRSRQTSVHRTGSFPRWYSNHCPSNDPFDLYVTSYCPNCGKSMTMGFFTRSVVTRHCMRPYVLSPGQPDL